jgi:predicted AlkP superfamily pyrophosphatase or phosphodiesterase
MPARIFSSVDLPVPLAPTRAVFSSGVMSQLAFSNRSLWPKRLIKRVLLISVDGMHAVDLKNCTSGISTVNNGAPFCPALAALGKNGVNYVAASTSKPSDSFPGLISIVTGGSPALTGIYYDVAYARNFDAPATDHRKWSCSRTLHSWRTTDRHNHRV